MRISMDKTYQKKFPEP